MEKSYSEILKPLNIQIQSSLELACHRFQKIKLKTIIFFDDTVFSNEGCFTDFARTIS